MSRRGGRRDRPRRWPAIYQDPLVTLAFDRAWRADDAVDNGSVTTSLASYIGSATPLAANGTGQAIKTRSANMNGNYSVAFDGQAATGAYAAVALAGAPTAVTVVSVYRIGLSNPNAGMSALTAAGVVNTGISQLQSSNQQISRKGAATDASTTVVTPGRFVMVTVADANGVASYVNKRTPATAAGVAPLAGTTFQVGSLNSANLFTLPGEWSVAAYALRALTADEVAFVLYMFGLKYRITIGA
jgi:hypothetical protein